VGLKYIGNNRFDTKVTIKSGGGEVTGSFSVDGAIKEGGLSIPTLMEKMVVDENSTTFLNFVPINAEDGEVIITD